MKTYSVPRHIWRALYPVIIFMALAVAVVVAGMIVTVFAVFMSEGMDSNSDFYRAIMQDSSLAESFVNGLGGNVAAWGNSLANEIMAAYGQNAMWIQLATNAVQIAVLLPLLHFTRLANPRYSGGTINAPNVFLVMLAAMGFSLTASYLISFIDLTRYFSDYESLMGMIAGSSFISQLLAVGIVGPIAEEVCFRGLVQTRLSEWLPAWAAALISAVLFGIIHLNVLQGAYAFIFGVGLSLVYMKYKTIWAPIAGHIGFNIVGIIIDGVINATGAEIPPVLVIAPAAFAAVVCTWLIVKLPHNASLADINVDE